MSYGVRGGERSSLMRVFSRSGAVAVTESGGVVSVGAPSGDAGSGGASWFGAVSVAISGGVVSSAVGWVDVVSSRAASNVAASSRVGLADVTSAGSNDDVSDDDVSDDDGEA